jgi:trk system potassium uptake protein TrkA
MKACIIGLGVFGRSLALTLAELGVEVVALDLSETLVAAIKDEVSVAAVADASNPEALAMFPMAEMDVVVVGIGQDFEASLQATAHAQELGAKRVITRCALAGARAVVEVDEGGAGGGPRGGGGEDTREIAGA